jgi:putative salt-induced outer membrane protein YdiY
MMNWWAGLFVCALLGIGSQAVLAAEPTADTTAAAALAAPAPVDMVTLKDGSVLYGEVLEMASGLLHIKSPAAGDIIKVKWSEISTLRISRPIPFHLKEGTVLMATVEEGEPGMLRLKAEPMQGTLAVPIDAVKSVNPLVQAPVVYVGTITGGYSQSTGNSRLRSASVVGDFVARSEQLRLTINGRYVYGETENVITARNARGTIKLDFFLTKRLFWFASAYFEQDTFQDLKMRTALASGPGYQFIDRGDFDGIFKDITLYAEAGISYFNEDFRVAQDASSIRARWSMKFNWPMLEDRITIFHFDELYPSLENINNYYLTMDNGVRFNLYKGFVFAAQVTTRYNSRPAPGTGDTDHLYLLNLGYSFDTTRKR